MLQKLFLVDCRSDEAEKRGIFRTCLIHVPRNIYYLSPPGSPANTRRLTSCINFGPRSVTRGQHLNSAGPTSRVCFVAVANPVPKSQG